MPNSVLNFSDAVALAGADKLYLLQGAGLDRDRKVSLEKIREFCTSEGVSLFELNTSDAASGVLTLALGASTTSAFVAVSGTGQNPYTLHITGSVPAGCQINVLMLASGTLKLSSDATINGIDSTLSLSLGDSALLGRGTGTVWWGSATRSASAVDAAVAAEKTRAEAEATALSQAITAEANARASAITAEASARAAITAKAVRLNIADADPTTGVLVLNASEYACDLHVEVSGNPTIDPPPASPGYFTLQVDGALPAGCSIRIRGGMSGASWTTSGTLLPVQVHFTSSYSYGLGDLAYPSPAWLPLVEGGDLSAVVMYDGLTWCGNSTDLLALVAYNNAKRSSCIFRGTLTSTSGIISTTPTNLSAASIALSEGQWVISATAMLSNATAGTWYQASLVLGPLATAPAFTDDSMAHVSVPPPPSGEVYGYAMIPVPPKIVTGGVSYSLWGMSAAAAAVAVRGWTIKATPTVQN